MGFVGGLHDISIVARADIDLDPPGAGPEDQVAQLVGRYHMGDRPEIRDLYALQIKLEALVGDLELSNDAAMIGATIRIHVRDGEDEQTEVLAHEFTITAVGHIENFDIVVPLPCPPDVNGDDDVGPPDLANLLDNWGACPAPPAECPADFNGDGDVGPPDLAGLLDNWGPCVP